MLELSERDSLTEIWPNLELYMHGGVNFEPYRKTFESLIPDYRFRYYQTYNASEGFFAYQDINEADDMALALNNGVYYEFLPADQYSAEHPRTVPLSDVEVGRQYAMVISTNAGLWRYRIGDTVEFTSVHPFRIRVSGRTKHFINAFGEEVIVENADLALTRAAHDRDAVVREYTAAPVYLDEGENGRHQWLIEFERRPADMRSFAVSLDGHLQALNSDYEAKRSNDLALDLPEIIIAREGLFFSWLKSKGKLGGQNKVPRLSNDRELIEELLSMNAWSI